MSDFAELANDMGTYLNEYTVQIDQIAKRVKDPWPVEAIQSRRASINRQRKIVTILEIVARDARISALVAEQMGSE
jgi:hypothetical protein